MAFLNAVFFRASAGGTSAFADGTAEPGYRNLAGASAVNGAIYGYRALSDDESEWEVGLGTYNSGSGVLERAAVAAGTNGTSAVDFTAAPRVMLTPLASELFIAAVAADLRSNQAGNLALTPVGLWSAANNVGLTDGATIAVDLSTGINFTVEIAGNRTLGNPTNPKINQMGVIRVHVDGTNRQLNVGSNWKSKDIAWPITIANGTYALIYYHVRDSDSIIVAGLVNGPG